MNAPVVSIIILNWNGLEDTTECLNSLMKIAYASYEVIVVDNCSDGNDAEVLNKRFGSYIHLICNDNNYGCGEGFNVGMRHVLNNSDSDYILLMNNDIVVDPAFLDHMVEIAESDGQIGMVGPKIYYYDHHGRHDVVWSAGGKIRWWAPKIPQQLGQNDSDVSKYQTTAAVDWISGAVLLFKRRLVEQVGLLDPWYFLGHEDVDYCLRARKHGFRIVYVPSARVWHKVAASAKKAHITYADPAAYYHFVRKSFPLPVYFYQLLLFPALLLRWGVLYLRENRDKRVLRTFASALVRFILQRPRRDLQAKRT